MDFYSDLRSLAIRVLFARFSQRTNPSADMFDSMPDVTIKLFSSEHQERSSIHLPLTLIQSICVVLSIWKDGNMDDDQEVSAAVGRFVVALLRPDDENYSDVECGLASAKMKDDDAVAVESVSKLLC